MEHGAGMRAAVLLVATVVAGLQAGTYFIFTSGVMPGLALGDDRTYVAAMQQMNVSFMNPWFLGSFVGAPLLALAATVLHARVAPTVALWAGVGFGLVTVTVVITGVVYVPLNDAISAAGPADAITDLATVRAAHEAVWVPWNLARTLTSTAGLAALGWALRLAGRRATSRAGSRAAPGS